MSGGPSRQVRVPAWLHLQSRLFAATAGFWRRMGDLETAAVRDEIETLQVDRPIYVSSLARAGTTIVTEMLERHPDLTSHRYSDFPNTWTPYWRNYLLQKSRRETPVAEERAHKDRIMVSQDSPEAVEEVLWMHFFPRCHEAGRDNTLDASTDNGAFEAFYRDHIRKLLAVRGTPRYLAKGNYNVARFAYIHKLFPDARFLVPYRNPENHIASLRKQHEFFLREHQADPRVGRQLSMAGHYEFGPFRKAVHFGNDSEWQAIQAAWQDGREVEGWARYWAATYRFLLRQAEANSTLGEAILFFAYEDLCQESSSVIDRMIGHCDLPAEPFSETKARYVESLAAPDYYEARFDDEERELIERVCGTVKANLDAASSR